MDLPIGKSNHTGYCYESLERKAKRSSDGKVYKNVTKKTIVLLFYTKAE